MWYWNGMGLWGMTMMLVFWAVVVFLILWAVRTTTTPQQRNDNTALRILDERLARGEIDRQEYEERREVLTGRR